MVIVYRIEWVCPKSRNLEVFPGGRSLHISPDICVYYFFAIVEENMDDVGQLSIGSEGCG